ncbi:MAG: hypothetical protein AAF573_09285 [Bacteroidota bacterium]
MEQKLLILFTIITCAFSATAQMPTASINKKMSVSVIDNDTSLHDSNRLYFLARESFPLDVSGRLYLDNDFRDGVFVDFSDQKIQARIRYRIADDEMQILHLGTEKALYPSKVKQIQFNSSLGKVTFVPAEYEPKKYKVYGYFELLSDGKVRLLKSHRKSGKHKIKCAYYLQKEGEIAQPFKARRSSIKKAFKNLTEEADDFISSNHINIKQEKDLIQLFDYLNGK